MCLKKTKKIAFILASALLCFSLGVGCGDEGDNERPVAAGTMSEDEVRQSMQRSEGGRKIIFLGIDAADWDIIMPLVERGLMPNMKKIVDNGAWGKLESFGATASPIVWTTIATGKMPNKHGIVNFIVKDEDSSDTRPIDSTYRKTKAIWNMFSDAGLTVGIIDWQISFPPERVNGYVISNLLHNEKFKSNPPEEQEYFEREVTLKKSPPANGESEWDKIIRSQMYGLDYVEAVGLAMQSRHEVDFLAVYTHSIDEIQHQFWKFKSPEYFQDPVWDLKEEEVEKYHSVIDDFHVRVDEMIGKLMETGCTIVLASDHGSTYHTSKRTFFQMDRLLSALGYLKVKDDQSKAVDFSRTQAYSGGFSRWDKYVGVSANIQGREPGGIVMPDSREPLIKYLVEKLSKIKIVETGEPIFEAVTSYEDFERKEEIVSVVDIVICQKTMLFYANPTHHIDIEGKKHALVDFLEFDRVSGRHALYGILVAMGEGIKVGRIRDSKMVDVAPTLLYMMGLPTGKDMDGDVIKGMFVEEYLKENPIRYVESYDAIGEKLAQKEEERGTSTVNDEIKAKLRALGYID